MSGCLGSRDPAQTVILMNFGSCFFPHCSILYPYCSLFQFLIIHRSSLILIFFLFFFYCFLLRQINDTRVRQRDVFRLVSQGPLGYQQAKCIVPVLMKNSPGPLRQSLHDRAHGSLLSVDQCQDHLQPWSLTTAIPELVFFIVNHNEAQQMRNGFLVFIFLFWVLSLGRMRLSNLLQNLYDITFLSDEKLFARIPDHDLAVLQSSLRKSCARAMIRI